MNKLTAEKCREQFEEWFEDYTGYDVTEYPSVNVVDVVWQAWQASRDVLHILEQQERGEGEWIEWKGGECPVDAEDIVQVKFKDETESLPSKAGTKYWSRVGLDTDIIAYRIIPERTTNQNGEVS